MYDVNIQHGNNIGEFRIPNTKYSADGYCKETNAIYEFHGDYWHGNPNKFIQSEMNITCKKTFREILEIWDIIWLLCGKVIGIK